MKRLIKIIMYSFLLLVMLYSAPKVITTDRPSLSAIVAVVSAMSFIAIVGVCLTFSIAKRNKIKKEGNTNVAAAAPSKKWWEAEWQWIKTPALALLVAGVILLIVKLVVPAELWEILWGLPLLLISLTIIVTIAVTYLPISKGWQRVITFPVIILVGLYTLNQLADSPPVREHDLQQLHQTEAAAGAKKTAVPVYVPRPEQTDELIAQVVAPADGSWSPEVVLPDNFFGNTHTTSRVKAQIWEGGKMVREIPDNSLPGISFPSGVTVRYAALDGERVTITVTR